MNAGMPMRTAIGATAFLLASCNSGGGNVQVPGIDFDGVAQEATVELTGTLVAGGGTARICLDEDRNLRCDEGEPATSAAAGGYFRLAVPGSADLAHGLLLAEFPAAGAASAPVDYVLAAPAEGNRQIDILGTLVAVRMQQNRALTPEAAWQLLERDFRLENHLPLWRMRWVTAAPQWQEVERAALAALPAASREARRLDGALDARAATLALPQTVSRYIDPKTRGMLPTVGERTLLSDLVGTATDRGCPIPQLVRIEINTAGGVPILAKDDKIDATVRLDGAADAAENFVANAEVSGRGNSTWGMPKKPYKLKFDRKIAVLGMPSGKKWALLANYSDKTMLRNAVAFCLSYKLGMDYSPQSRFAELTMNGEYLGLYQITNKVDEVEKAVEKDDPQSADDGFVLEMDDRLDGDFWFYSSFGIPYVVGSDSSPAQLADIERWMNGVEQSLTAAVASGDISGLGVDFDLDSFVDLYLVNELLRNNDGFWSSTYVYRLGAGQPLMFGPVWDFDIAAGNIDYNGNEATEGWWARNASHHFRQLRRDADFNAHVAARWRYLSSQMPQLRRFIASSAAALDQAQQRNFARWPILDIYVWPNAVVTGSYASEIDYLDNWLKKRATWIDGELLAAD